MTRPMKVSKSVQSSVYLDSVSPPYVGSDSSMNCVAFPPSPLYLLVKDIPHQFFFPFFGEWANRCSPIPFRSFMTLSFSLSFNYVLRDSLVALSSAFLLSPVLTLIRYPPRTLHFFCGKMRPACLATYECPCFCPRVGRNTPSQSPFRVPGFFDARLFLTSPAPLIK